MSSHPTAFLVGILAQQHHRESLRRAQCSAPCVHGRQRWHELRQMPASAGSGAGSWAPGYCDPEATCARAG